MLLTKKYTDKIKGVLSCFDRMIIKGTLPHICYAQGMTSYLNAKKIRIFDYPKFAEQFNTAIRENAERMAKEKGIEIEFIRKAHIRKEEIIATKIKSRGSHSGLVHILSVMESCPTYKPWHDKQSGKTYLKGDTSKCLHYYFYFIDEQLGLCYVRVPTWCPFGLQIYFNGHAWLASLLKQKSIDYHLIDNAFVEISDYQQAQELSNHLSVESLHHKLDAFAETYCPVMKSFEQVYHWSLMQVEYATDIVFNKKEYLQAIYDDLIKTAIHVVTPDNIATFLGKKLHGNFQGEMGNRYNLRIEGRRIKHTMESAAIKMYDKFGQILRIETTTNKISFFKHYREIEQRNGSTEKRYTNFKKNIYSLPPLREVLQAANGRYLEFISEIQTHEIGNARLDKVSQSVESNHRRYKGFNFFDKADVYLFQLLFRGEHCIQGFRNKTLRKHLPMKTSGQISRLLKRLKVHGLIKRAKDSYTYYLTSLGKTVISTAMKIKHLVIIPELVVLQCK